MQAVELQQPSSRKEAKSPTGFVLGGTTKMVMLIVLFMLLYFRLFLRKRKKDKICSHCGHRNPPHRQNCHKCSAPLSEI